MRCISPISIKDPRGHRGFLRLDVPCNKCGICLSNRRSQWSFRLAEEFKHSKSAIFITLTYNDLTVPKSGAGLPQLNKRDFQLFMKRLRKTQSKYTHDKIRYYSVGEYGSLTHRPHYHAIIYNGNLNINNHIQECWSIRKSHPLGLIHTGNVTAASIHYITKYHVNYENDFKDQRQPEFATMSRNPGIGYQYVNKTKKWHKANKNNYVINNGYKQLLPRYYREKIFSPLQREIMALESLQEAEALQIAEESRLSKLNYSDPVSEIENRNYNKSLSIIKKAKAQDKI